MTEDSLLIAVVCAIWVALAALYAFVPLFAMPGSALVWGSGALVFLILAVVTIVAERRLPRNEHQE
jgi:membrane protein implicated in regulation of membrane protease activity